MQPANRALVVVTVPCFLWHSFRNCAYAAVVANAIRTAQSPEGITNTKGDSTLTHGTTDGLRQCDGR